MVFILGVQNARFHPNFSLFIFGFIYKSLSYRTKSGIPQGFHKGLSAKVPLSVMPFPTERVFTFLSAVSAGIYNLTPIKVAPLKCGNDDLCRCDVGCNGNIVKVAHTEKLHFRLVDLGIGTGISEIEQYVYLVIRNAGSDLLFAACLTRHKSVYLKTGCLGNKLCGGSGGT